MLLLHLVLKRRPYWVFYNSAEAVRMVTMIDEKPAVFSGWTHVLTDSP